VELFTKNIKYFFGFIFLLVVVFSWFLFFKKDKIKNYPSNGVDIIAFGDSLIEGIGSTSGNDLVSLLSQKTGRKIINLGVSGNTTEDGLNRISQLDNYNPKVVILLLGGNDYLRKVPVDQTFSNLEKIITHIQSRGSVVVLLGVRGSLIDDKYKDRYEALSRKYETVYVEDVLSGLFGNNQYMSDAVHPNDLGYKKIAERVYPVLIEVIR
jgi:lysophospholipase L1-like esterase